jgi:3-oxoacyl-[acyl-carrier protein] reductase
VTHAVAQLRAQLGPIDVVVNNAGVVVRDDVMALSDADWLHVHAVNTHGPLWMIRACGDDLRARGGRVINVASIAGELGTAKLTAYCSSKHAVVGLTRSLAKEWAPDRVLVVAICPGSVDTDMLKIGMPHGKPDMTPDDIAEVALFLAGRAPYAMTGGCVDVHG